MEFAREIARVLEPALNEEPTRVAVVAASGSLTYEELDRRANRWSRALREAGIAPGDRVAVSLPNDLDIVAAFHGAMRLGAVWVGVNSVLAPPEKAFMIKDSGAKLLLCEATTASELSAETYDLPAGFDVGVVAGEGSEDWSSALAALDSSPLGMDVDPFAPAGIAYTSGTTGFPKGVVHSQWNLLTPGAQLTATRQYGTDLRKGDCFPLTILNMLILTTLLTAQAKGRAVIMDKVSSDSVTRWVRDEGVTVWNGPPPLLFSLAHDDGVAPAELASLREVWSGGADCPEAIRNAFESKFGVEVRGTYGLTEAPTVVAIEVPETDHLPGSSGVPLPHLEVTIRNGEGEPLAAGEAGEICVAPRGRTDMRRHLTDDWGVESGDDLDLPEYQPMLGYWNRPKESAAALAGGFLRTGDAGTLSAEGILVVSDRISLMLNRGGANVYPAEIERVVMDLAGVDSCGVFGVPDERLGERVGLLVEFEPATDPDLDAVIAHCRGQLAPYKVPELVAPVASLPRNAMGKIDRRELSDLGARLVAGQRRSRSAG